MSNNKQSMKLYTETEILSLLKIHLADEEQADSFVALLTPIELPSDEEIEEMGKDVIIYNDTKRRWFIEGLKFMRDKIQGGNQ